MVGFVRKYLSPFPFPYLYPTGSSHRRRGGLDGFVAGVRACASARAAQGAIFVMLAGSLQLLVSISRFLARCVESAVTLSCRSCLQFISLFH